MTLILFSEKTFCSLCFMGSILILTHFHKISIFLGLHVFSHFLVLSRGPIVDRSRRQLSILKLVELIVLVHSLCLV